MNDTSLVLDELLFPEIEVKEEEYLIKFQYSKRCGKLLERWHLLSAFNYMRRKCPSNFWTCIHVYIHTHDRVTGEEVSITNETLDIPYRNVSAYAIQNLFYTLTGSLENDSEIDFSLESVRVDYLKIVMKRTKPRKKYQRKGLSNRLRTLVLDRDNYQCQMCGKTREDGVKLEVDHIIPVSKGGTNELDNLQTLCHGCNHGKFNNMDLKATRERLEGLK